MRFDLVDLKLLLDVAEAGSITSGAARSSLALASASERVRGMERDAGTALLERRRRGVALTPAGHALSRHARAILDQCERMRGELALHASGLKAHVRVMANTSAIAEHLPQPLAAFLSQNPHVDLDLEEALSSEIALAVAAGRVDFGLMSDQVDTGDLETRPFRRDDLMLIARPDHPLAGRASVDFVETLAFEHVGLAVESSLQGALAGYARRLGRTIRLRARLGGFDAVCRMAEQGVGLAIVPRAAADRALRSMAVRAVPISDPWAKRMLVIATRRDAEPSPQAASLIAHLVAEAGPQEVSGERPSD